MHIMIDLETMGTRPNAPIVSIGAVAFSREAGTVSQFFANVSLESSVKSGAVIDPSTVEWWLKQEDAARKDLLKAPASLELALAEFSEWLLLDRDLAGVWGNGASFDNIILSESYRRLGGEAPWPFHLDRCYRTIKALWPPVDIVRFGTHHNALDDARHQAEVLLELDRRHGVLSGGHK